MGSTTSHASQQILASSYTSSIFTLSFTPPNGSSPATLKLIHSTEVGPNPSWVDFLPSMSGKPDTAVTATRTIVTVEESSQGEVRIVEFADPGTYKKGKVVRVVGVKGKDPCHLTLIESDLIGVANYSSGSLTLVGLKDDDLAVIEFPFEPSASSKKIAHRQEAAHAHQVVYVPDPGYGEVLVPDLGNDVVWRLQKKFGKWEVVNKLVCEEGTGPRHVVYSDGYLYVLGELSNTLSVYTFPPLSSSQHPQLLQSLPSLETIPTPEEQKAFGLETNAAELILSQDKKTLFYTTRNVPGPQGDILTIFSVPTPGEIVRVKEVPTGLAHLRGATLSPDGKWLILAGAFGGGVKVFSISSNDVNELTALSYGDSFEKITGFAWA